MNEIYDLNDYGPFALIYNIGANAVDIMVMEVEEGVFDILKTLKDYSINDEILHHELVDRVKELYPELEDVSPSLVSVKVFTMNWSIDHNQAGRRDGEREENSFIPRHCPILHGNSAP